MLVPEVTSTKASELATKIQAIDMMQFYLSQDDIIQFVKTYYNE
jgi:hypothetical protein